MSDDTTLGALNLQNKTEAKLKEIADAHTGKHAPLVEYYDARGTLFGWTDDGKGVWVLPLTKANFDRFEDIARLQPRLGQCELLELAGAAFFCRLERFRSGEKSYEGGATRDSQRQRGSKKQLKLTMQSHWDLAVFDNLKHIWLNSSSSQKVYSFHHI
ncbi:hypothetical protein F5Y16DRAFT_188388 [Xylariaceae sp. FL0255]|nr:hypothetical protein F5Y16DRAFT_188388 [Xylariaceae sp. FL0255]